jgi:hypothetical protein
MAGFPLKLGGVACVGALSCGPVVDDPTVSASGDASSGTGFDLTTTGPPTSSSPTDSDSSAGATPECYGRGEICSELFVCQCNCDYSTDCCYCSPAACTDDTHCAAGEVCVNASAYFTDVELACVPAVCSGSTFVGAYVSSLREAMSHENDVCLSRLSIYESGLADLMFFTNLEYVHGELSIHDNAELLTLGGLESVQSVGALDVSNNLALTSVAGLGGLQEIREGGAIRDNPALPAADVHALLAGIDGGDAVQVCGNLDDVAC